MPRNVVTLTPRRVVLPLRRHRAARERIERALVDKYRARRESAPERIEIDLAQLEDTARFPFPWQPTWMAEALRQGEAMPPVVVVQTDRGRGLGLIDGLNRTYAHWLSGKPTIRAYELLLGGHS